MADGEAQKILDAVAAMISPLKAIMIKTCALSEEMAPHFAKLARTYYDAYKKQGFSDEQALEMAKHGIVMASTTAQGALRQ